MSNTAVSDHPTKQNIIRARSLSVLFKKTFDKKNPLHIFITKNGIISITFFKFFPLSKWLIAKLGCFWQWQIQEFQNPGAQSRRGRILGFWELFWCPFTHTLCFCCKSTEWNTFCKYCMLTTIKENACYTVKIFKNKYKKIFT